MNRSFLKWAGGKYKLLNRLLPLFPQGERFVEPFVGSGTVFINVDYSSYIINDSNQDLANIFECLRLDDLEKFISSLRELFNNGNNKEKYLDCREFFNSQDVSRHMKSLLFIYLNRHGFNGLCRYNKRGEFNVPFGKYKSIYFPERELRTFALKLQECNVIDACMDFIHIFDMVRKDDVVYCDPPYVPLSKTSNFTQYFGKVFGETEQMELAFAAERAANKGARVLISNHDVEFTRELYKNADIISFDVGRTISADGKNRGNVKELVAIF
jgi:DNA adenine methylase